MGNEVFTDVFYDGNAMDFDGMFGPGIIIGAIGNRFLLKHKLVLDYRAESLHTSNEKLEGEPKDFDFYFPMSFGMMQYNLPVVGMINGDKELLMIADSGANATTVTEYALQESGFEYEDMGQKGSSSFYAHDDVETTIKNVTFNLASFEGTTDKIKLCSFKEECHVIDNVRHLLDEHKGKDGEYVPPISGLLSSSFMYRHKWVLDFALGVIYAQQEGMQ